MSDFIDPFGPVIPFTVPFDGQNPFKFERSGNFWTIKPFYQNLLSTLNVAFDPTETKVKRLLGFSLFEYRNTSDLQPCMNQTLGYGLPLRSWKKQQHAVKSLTHKRGFGMDGWMEGSERGVWTLCEPLNLKKKKRKRKMTYCLIYPYVANYGICLQFILFTLVMLGPGWLTFSVVFVVFWSGIWLALGDGCLKWA